MNWYKFIYSANFDETMAIVHSALLCMRYSSPDIDLTSSSLGDILIALEEAGCMDDIPLEVNRERFAAMVGFLVRNPDVGAEL
tara:strand:- start:1162 stop:1410 length:249 start_codon:yes stop_codon:yes gene_type:complete